MSQLISQRSNLDKKVQGLERELSKQKSQLKVAGQNHELVIKGLKEKLKGLEEEVTKKESQIKKVRRQKSIERMKGKTGANDVVRKTITLDMTQEVGREKLKGTGPVSKQLKLVTEERDQLKAKMAQLVTRMASRLQVSSIGVQVDGGVVPLITPTAKQNPMIDLQESSGKKYENQFTLRETHTHSVEEIMAVPPKHKRLVSWGENNSHYNLYRQ